MRIKLLHPHVLPSSAAKQQPSSWWQRIEMSCRNHKSHANGDGDTWRDDLLLGTGGGPERHDVSTIRPILSNRNQTWWWWSDGDNDMLGQLSIRWKERERHTQGWTWTEPPEIAHVLETSRNDILNYRPLNGNFQHEIRQLHDTFCGHHHRKLSPTTGDDGQEKGRFITHKVIALFGLICVICRMADIYH